MVRSAFYAIISLSLIGCRACLAACRDARTSFCDRLAANCRNVQIVAEAD